MDDLDALKPYYRIETHGGSYHIYCKQCSKAWTLPVGKVSIGATLKLLDHAHSHKGDNE